jgi:hypothetical protein
LFAAYLQHSTISAPISYVVFPGTTQQQFAKRSSKVMLQVVQNDPSISAVLDQKNNVAMFIFWAQNGGSIAFSPGPGFATISLIVTANVAILFRLDTGEITASDPSQSLINVQASFTVGTDGRRPKGWGNKAPNSKTIVFQFPQDGLAGSSVTDTLD